MPLFNRACLIAGLCLSPLLQAENDQFTVGTYGDYGYLSLATLQQQYPQIQIRLKNVGWGDHHSKLTQHLYTGNFFADVSFIDQTQLSQIIDRIELSDLSEYVPNINKNYSSAALLYGQNQQGTQVALPIDLGPHVLFYRQDLLAELQIDSQLLSKDYDSLLQVARAAKQQDIYFNFNAVDLFNMHLVDHSQQGESLYFDLDNQPKLTQPHFIKALDYAMHFVDEELSLESGVWSDRWYSGLRGDTQVLTSTSGLWLNEHLKGWIAPDLKDSWQVTQIPAKVSMDIGGTYLIAPKHAHAQPAVIKDFLSGLLTESAIIQRFEQHAQFPSHLGSQQHASLQQADAYFSGQAINQQGLLALNKKGLFRSHPFDHIAEHFLKQAYQQAKNGKSSAAALAWAEQQLLQQIQKLTLQAQ